MIGKSKIAWALLGIALLLVNPAGVCAGTPSVHSPSHPCCPAAPAQHQGSGTGTCVCIDRQPAPPALPSLDGSYSIAVAPTDTLALLITIGTEIPSVSDRADITLENRFLTFHQILV